MSKPTIDASLVRFVDMVSNPIRFDPITYEDRTKGWVDVEVPLNKIRVKDIVNHQMIFGEGKAKRMRTERYAVLDVQGGKEDTKGDWKLYNRIATEDGSWSPPAFAQLCNRVREHTNVTTTDIKKLITPQHNGQDENGRWLWMDETEKAVAILNKGLAQSTDSRTLRFNPELNKIEAIVSDRYAPVTNKEVLTLLEAEIGGFNIVREFHDDRRSMFQVLPDKFAGMSDSEEYGLFIENSTTGANKLGMGMFVLTMVCTNGMMSISSQYGESDYLTRRHFGKTSDIIALIQEKCSIFDGKIKETHKRINLAKETPLRGEEYTETDLVDLLLKPLAESENLSKKTVNRVEVLLKERYQNDSVWDFISALTDAAHDVPAQSREHIEKVAGRLLEVMTPTITSA